MAEPTDPLSDQWFTTGGLVVHPDAPAGAGGAGGFRAAGSLGTDEPHVPVLPSPASPAGRYVVTPEPLDTEAVKKNPAPATPAGLTPLYKLQDTKNDVDVSVNVLADGVNSSEPGQAHTALLVGDVTLAFPTVETNDTTGKITKLLSKFTLKGTLTIQTRYRAGVDREALSAYGRGTGDDDKKVGNTTVGFHEVCHVRDMVAWLKAHPAPPFPGLIGKTAAEYQEITEAYGKLWDAHLASASEDSHSRTDQTGNPTRSAYLATNR